MKKNEGITLVALVITIVILIILATITINAAFGENGLIEKAQSSKKLTEEVVKNETNKMNALFGEYSNIMAEDINKPVEPMVNEVDPTPKPDEPTIDDAKQNGEKFENTTEIRDDLNNDIPIPGGFHIPEDSGTSVEEGIVIEDDSGNQFVWIPVGEYKVSTTVNTTGKLTNNLSRREWGEANEVKEPTEIDGDSAIKQSSLATYYGEGNSNSVAKDQIEEFKESAKNYGGFYIGRYEQGKDNVCKANVVPYTDITRDQAKTQAEAMYDGNNYVVSELISSYAWDTALNFICQTNKEGYLLATTTSSAYGITGNNDIIKTGETTVDIYNKIFDFFGNCQEWTTEYCSNILFSGVERSGNGDEHIYYAALRAQLFAIGYDVRTSFRVQLYVK